MGFPAYPNDPPNHYASAEDTEYAALGATIGTDTLNTTSVEILGVWNSFSARPTFRGAAVYLTTDGSGSDGYASWAVDWNNFAAYW